MNSYLNFKARSSADGKGSGGELRYSNIVQNSDSSRNTLQITNKNPVLASHPYTPFKEDTAINVEVQNYERGVLDCGNQFKTSRMIFTTFSATGTQKPNLATRSPLSKLHRHMTSLLVLHVVPAQGPFRKHNPKAQSVASVNEPNF